MEAKTTWAAGIQQAPLATSRIGMSVSNVERTRSCPFGYDSVAIVDNEKTGRMLAVRKNRNPNRYGRLFCHGTTRSVA